VGRKKRKKDFSYYFAGGGGKKREGVLTYMRITKKGKGPATASCLNEKKRKEGKIQPYSFEGKGGGRKVAPASRGSGRQKKGRHPLLQKKRGDSACKRKEGWASYRPNSKRKRRTVYSAIF